MNAPASVRRPPLSLFPDGQGPRLYDRLIEVLRIHHYSRRTEEAYVGWIRRFIQFHHGQHPHSMGVGEVTAFLSHLAVQGRVAARAFPSGPPATRFGTRSPRTCWKMAMTFAPFKNCLAMPALKPR